jgi:hypothetical protein
VCVPQSGGFTSTASSPPRRLIVNFSNGSIGSSSNTVVTRPVTGFSVLSPSSLIQSPSTIEKAMKRR